MWQQKGQLASIPVKSLQPSISVLLAINNHGDGYISLSQSKTDSARVILFMEYFFKKLDMIESNWRSECII